MRPDLKAAFQRAAKRAADRQPLAGVALDASLPPTPKMPYLMIDGELRPAILRHRGKPTFTPYAVSHYPGGKVGEYLAGLQIAEPQPKCMPALEVARWFAANWHAIARGVLEIADGGLQERIVAFADAKWIVVNDSFGNEVDRWDIASVVPAANGKPEAARSWWKRMLLGW